MKNLIQVDFIPPVWFLVAGALQPESVLTAGEWR